YALVVDAAAEIGFALDVDDAPAAHEAAGRDAYGLAERVVAGLQQRDAVDLAGFPAVHVHQQRAAPDGFENVLLDLVGAVHFGLHRPLHVPPLDDAGTFLPRPQARLGHDFGDLVEARGQLVPVARQPAAELNDPCDARRRKGRQVFQPAA